MRIKNTLNHLNKLIDYNSNLNEAQKNRLRQTPFKWVVDMTDHIKVSGPLLEELLGRWDSISHGFRVGCKTVAFAPADVCIALGLQIVGTTVPVPLNDNSDCRVKSLFNGEDVTIDSILQKLNVLNTEQDIEDFCRVYILFAFFALYFPKKSRNVTSVPFKLLDDLNLLETYNWGQAVYEDLVESINTAAAKYAQSGGDPGKEITLSGCSAILQIWVVEKLQLCDISAKCFPRINKWTTLPYHGNEMQNIFANAKLVEDLVPTEEDQQFNVLLKPFDSLNLCMQMMLSPAFMHDEDV
ncbi:uncharacterized protein LOC123895748 [Trifolium pratense]|uniref:uncharacterized protein LOC123895748 n=1 Tax=Trifolium pratense TaxID=57577 RepID=UPI001E697A76|nr:uncharacterized protein LOC123895748 [Trifolium pratense]